MRPPVRAHRLRRDAVTISASALPAPVLTYVVASDQWRLEEPYEYTTALFTLAIPAGFGFDLASVPRWLWWLIAPFELSIAAPLVHDYVYRYGGRLPPGVMSPPRTLSRRDTDGLFRSIMAEEGVRAWRRFAAFGAVRLFGAAAWQTPERR